MFKNAIILGSAVALVTGVAIGVQSFLSGRAGAVIGPINTGFWTNFLGGAMAGFLILVVSRTFSPQVAVINRQGLVLTLIAGALGILIIMGVSFSIQRAGMAAGMAAVILGQFLFGVIADTTGLGGLAPIPLDLRRITGLVGLAISVYLLLPKK